MLKSFRFSVLNVALCYVAVTLAALGLFATPLWFAWRDKIEGGRTAVVEADAQRMRHIFVNQGADALIAIINSRVGGEPPAEGRIVLLADPLLTKLAGNLPAWPREISESEALQTRVINIGSRNLSAFLLHEKLPGGYHLLVGRDVSRFVELETLFLYGLAGSGILVLTIAIIGGLLTRRALLSRVDHIRQTASRIVEGDLTRRLPTLNERDGLEMLTRTINRMLDQIELLVHGVRNTSNAIAHDLRTPLAELRSRLEELALTRPSPNQTFAEIDAAIADLDRVMAIFNALLRLAEIDSGMRRSGFVDVDVTRLAGEVAEFYQPVAELKGIALAFHSLGNLSTPGDPILLAQAIGNLIDNALKYAKQDGAVSIEARRRSSRMIEVVVADDGPGIPDEEKPRVVERFYRSDASRATPGVGLGLSMVAAAARLHGGSLELADNHPGLRATLILALRDMSGHSQEIPAHTSHQEHSRLAAGSSARSD
ncbi:MAG: sensor histidine kinase [Burkholderia sp.]|nr:sensor histidine kinase [Burkholderia sp.]